MVVLLVLFGAILLSPIELKIDTRIPVISIQWKGIGEAIIIYEEVWWLKIRLPFFHKQWSLIQLILSDKKKKTRVKVKAVQRKKKKEADVSFKNSKHP